MRNTFSPSFWKINQQVTFRRVALLACILLSGGNLIIPRLPLAILVLLIAVYAFGFLSSRINTRKTVIYLWLALVMTLAFLRVHHVDVAANVTRLTNFVIALAMLKIYWGDARHLFLGDIRAVMMPVTILGLITVVLALVMPGLFPLVQIGQQQMHTLGGVFNYIMPLSRISVPRPMGIFWEPGLFAAYLNILLFALLVRKDSLWALAAVFGTILLTQSTTGIGVALAILGYFLLKTLFSRRVKIREIFLMIVAILSIPGLASVAINNFSDKFSGAGAGSFAARYFDFSVAARVIEENPLVGIGFSPRAYWQYAGDSALDVSSLAVVNQDGRFNTNGVMLIIYSVGLPLGLLYFLGLFRQHLVPDRSAFGLAVSALLASSPLSLTPFFLFLAFSGLVLRASSSRDLRIHWIGPQPFRPEHDLSHPLSATLSDTPHKPV